MRSRRNLILGAALAMVVIVPTVAGTLSGRAFTWDKTEVSCANAKVEVWDSATAPVKFLCNSIADWLKK